MDVLLSGTILASESSGYPPEGFLCNGVRVIEAVDLARAVSKSLFVRGNAVHTLTFTTVRPYATNGLAQVASLMALANAPASGQLEIRCGSAGEQLTSVFFANAVVQSAPGQTVGCSASVAWTILATLPSTTAPSDFVNDPDAPNSMRGIQPIDNGSQIVPIAFSTALANPVVSSMTVQVPPGGDTIGIVGVSDISSQGFSAHLSAPVPAGGYFLHWQANVGPSQ